jgi:hypothetical protein
MQLKTRGHPLVSFVDSTLSALISKGLRSGIVVQQLLDRYSYNLSSVVIHAFKDLQAVKLIIMDQIEGNSQDAITPQRLIDAICECVEETGLSDLVLVQGEERAPEELENMSYAIAVDVAEDDPRDQDAIKIQLRDELARQDLLTSPPSTVAASVIKAIALKKEKNVRVQYARAMEDVLAGAQAFVSLPEFDKSHGYAAPEYYTYRAEH